MNIKRRLTDCGFNYCYSDGVQNQRVTPEGVRAYPRAISGKQ